jgi:integrase
MGPRLKLPRYVHGFLDRHGRPRYYYRRAGFNAVPLPGLPYSPEFMTAYESALAGQPSAPAARAIPGTMNALALSFFAAPAFSTLRPSTRSTYRWTIGRLCREHGDKRVALLRRDHIVKLMAARTPGAANKLRKALRAMMKHAVDVGMISDDPTSQVRAINTRAAGFHSWSDLEISQFEECHPIGSRARLAMALLLHSGQRRGDVIRMGPQHVRSGVLYIKQEKTGAELAIPVHPDLATIIASAPSGHLTFLTTRFDRPFEASTFSHWFREQCDKAGLPHCSAHGLRKAAARRLAEAGCTAHEIGAVTGHASLAELVRYTRAADQRHLAEAAMAKTRTSSGKPIERLAKKARKTFNDQ